MDYRKILQTISSEDRLGLLSKETKAFLLNLLGSVTSTTNTAELKRTVNQCFTQIIGAFPSNSLEYAGALSLRDYSMKLIVEALNSSYKHHKDINDAIVNIYLESIHNFNLEIKDPLIYEHLCFLERDYPN